MFYKCVTTEQTSSSTFLTTQTLLPIWGQHGSLVAQWLSISEDHGSNPGGEKKNSFMLANGAMCGCWYALVFKGWHLFVGLATLPILCFIIVITATLATFTILLHNILQ